MGRRGAGQRQDSCVKALHGLLKLLDKVSKVRGLSLFQTRAAPNVPTELSIVEGENIFKVCTPPPVGRPGPAPIASAIRKAGREADAPRLANGRIAHGVVAEVVLTVRERIRIIAHRRFFPSRSPETAKRQGDGFSFFVTSATPARLLRYQFPYPCHGSGDRHAAVAQAFWDTVEKVSLAAQP